MGVNSVTAYRNQYTASASSSKARKTTEEKENTDVTSKAVIYEKSEDTATYSSSKSDRATIEQLKKDAQERTEALRQLVQKVLLKQGKTVSTASTTSSLIGIIKSGDFEVDEETRSKAEEEISEDGYWGVKQTSDRLFSFATALCGNDTGKADEMIAAFKKGYEMATKSWGEDLPDICQKTYDAFLSKMDQWKNPTTESDS